ncbi:MAG TPA: LuxR C-terminal-related transcriptional regulator [Candidatus Dormibacteraeota bacterium]|nr:LuxR C-terminal-related transcriptional regulator [Candidatus Dormibacteraeota bacterium]
MATELGVSESTVKNHLREVFRKLKVDSRAAAAARAVQLGLDYGPEEPTST